ncbi:AAA family ATPase [Brevibacillus sp. NPDC058079]|uniref:AAA family ATPase n=1 Tax=Brevibacillus sp. NPDC058079 TaxID=3346330 RepID=UPI0036E9C924
MSGKVYAIMSVVQGNGAKYVATNLARAMKRKEKKENNKILLVDFDFENPYLAYDFVKQDKTHGIDNLLPHIHESGISQEIFQENIIATRIDVDVLRGTQFIGKYKQFSKFHIEAILDTARKLYDIVIVVVSPKVNNAGTVYTLFHADQVILVLRNNYSNYLRVDVAMRIVNQYAKGENPTLIVYNMQNVQSKAEVNEKLKEFPFELKVAGVLEYDERSIDNVDLDKKESMFLSKRINAKTFAEIEKHLV